MQAYYRRPTWQAPFGALTECGGTGTKNGLFLVRKGSNSRKTSRPNSHRALLSAARDPHVKASLLWEGHLTAALRSINGTCGTGKKIDYSWMDAPDPDLPPVVYSANFSQYAYTHPTGLRSAIRVARVAVEMYRVEQVKCFLLSSQLQMLDFV
jgi:hypothetical protein